MKALTVTLRCVLDDGRGACRLPGETVSLPEALARRMIDMGAAEASAVRAQPQRKSRSVAPQTAQGAETDAAAASAGQETADCAAVDKGEVHE